MKKKRNIEFKIVNRSEQDLKIFFWVSLKNYSDIELNEKKIPCIIIKKNFSRNFQYNLKKVHRGLRSYLYIYVDEKNKLQIDVEDSGEYVIVYSTLDSNLIAHLFTQKDYQEELINQSNFFYFQDLGIQFHY